MDDASPSGITLIMVSTSYTMTSCQSTYSGVSAKKCHKLYTVFGVSFKEVSENSIKVWHYVNIIYLTLCLVFIAKVPIKREGILKVSIPY